MIHLFGSFSRFQDSLVSMNLPGNGINGESEFPRQFCRDIQERQPSLPSEKDVDLIYRDIEEKNTGQKWSEIEVKKISE